MKKILIAILLVGSTIAGAILFLADKEEKRIDA